MPWTKLHVAGESGDLKLAQEAVEQGVDVDARDDGEQTALHRAAGFGHAEVMALLLQMNAKVDASDESGSTPLHLAAWRGNVAVIDVLVGGGAKVNSKGMYGDTPLHLAASYGQLRACKALLLCNAEINAKDKTGKTPLDWAMEANQSAVTSLLLTEGALTSSAQREQSKTVAEGGEGVISEHLMKVLVVGDAGTGKTSYIKRYVHGVFTATYKATIGVDFALKSIPIGNNAVARLQLWDIAGQERFGAMTHVYYKEAVGALLMFDSTRHETFKSVAKWKADIDDKVHLSDGTSIPVVLLGSKSDLGSENAYITPDELDAYAKENAYAGAYFVSSKDGTNVSECAKFLMQCILERTQALEDVEHDSIVVKKQSAEDDGCCGS
eukprot:m.277068 g.277068  ORF g.277068 m.277068 type:complete len:382 (-) comp19780_c0_seq5:223-1368(-)